MAKVPVNTFRLLRRRAYCSNTGGGGAEDCVRVQREAAAKKAGDHWNSKVAGPISEHQKDHHHEVFWMRHPKTGYWVPESHFHDQVDVAELREKFLPKKTRSTF